ncbi:hypothetical protein OUZ56_026164 [Daphnia magna]|uniref:Uncharacterized protein n=1 Tax=Daphnia magna TaxID=35525 RepID=A0ABQ9ZL23_9CRUS|nr:hypothetical protein OUZ56_026164 [Daphnia magna]
MSQSDVGDTYASGSATQGCAPADRVSLEKMEQLLDSYACGPMPSSVWQKDSTVFIQLKNPDDFDRAKTILESKRN